MMWPNLHWDIEQSKKALEQLLVEGKVVELETGHYKPTESLKNQEAASSEGANGGGSLSKQ